MEDQDKIKKSLKRADYLWRLAHTYAPTNQPLAQFYMYRTMPILRFFAICEIQLHPYLTWWWPLQV
jgi:hypothetical protein